jgi:hypothetical protein
LDHSGFIDDCTIAKSSLILFERNENFDHLKSRKESSREEMTGSCREQSVQRSKKGEERVNHRAIFIGESGECQPQEIRDRANPAVLASPQGTSWCLKVESEF